MYHCLPVALKNGTLQVALADPLNPAHADEIGFVIKRDVQMVVADPAEIEKAIERFYGQEEAEGFSRNPQGTRSDADIAREVSRGGRRCDAGWRAWPTRRRS